MWIPFDRHPTNSKSSIMKGESVRVCKHDAVAANVAFCNMATDSTHCLDNSIFTVVNSTPTTAASQNRNMMPNSIADSIPTHGRKSRWGRGGRIPPEFAVGGR
jgi:hypothetical protein